MKKIITTIFAFLLMWLSPANSVAETPGGLQLKARAGWSIGGTAPLGVPATIRSIDAFRLTPSFMVGADVGLPLSDRWGLLTGLHFENKGMNVDVTAKAYHMEVRKGDSMLEGLFTGKVHQESAMWMFTLPVCATLQVSDCLLLKAGPYFSLLTSRKFEGIASDGYLRQGTPTGPKILMGDREGEWATFDLADDMRRFQTGITIGLDWQFYRSLGLSADLNWGLNGIFPKDYKTVEQTLYPIYGTISLFYRLR